jgi:hypothetical protein
MIKWFLTLTSFSCAGLIAALGLPEYIKYPPFWRKFMVAEKLGPYQDYFVYGFIGLGAFCLVFMSGSKGGSSDVVCKIKGYVWDLNDFCRGWLITGKTGSGKTASAIAHIIHQLFQNVNPAKKMKPWGGVAVDQKGNFFKIIEDIAANYKETDRLITLQVRKDNAPEDWEPKYKYNLLSYPGIPSSTYSKMIIDTAASLGQESGGSGGFFKTQAQLHIEKAIDLLKIIKFIKESPESIRLESNLSNVSEDGAKTDLQVYLDIPSFVSLKNIYDLLTDKELMQMTVGVLDLALELKVFSEINKKEHKQIEIISLHFKQKFLNQPPDQLGGVIGTINNYLGFFTSDDICEVFCAEENTVEFEAVDKGIIFSVSMPQRFQAERVYVNTLMKMIYYTHALSRFDRPDELKENNLLIFIADEAQGVVTASKDGMTDYSVIDKIREARATVLFAAQSTTSFLPVMKKEQVDTLLLNLANQVHYTVADENNSKLIADQIGKKEMQKKSHGFSGGKRSVNYQKVDEHKIKPHILRAMKKFECVLIHCERGFKKLTLKPISPSGKIPEYYSKIKR